MYLFTYILYPLMISISKMSLTLKQIKNINALFLCPDINHI